MATTQVKVVMNVMVPTPKPSLEKQSTTEKNEVLRTLASELVTDALTLASLKPVVLRVRLAKGDK
jgi:hypothetical protein